MKVTSCDINGIYLATHRGREFLPYGEIANIRHSSSLLWTRLSIETLNGRAWAVPGLPKKAGRLFAAALKHNRVVSAHRLATQLAADLEEVERRISVFTAGTRYLPDYLARAIIQRAEALAPLLVLQQVPSVLPVAIESRLRQVSEFLANHSSLRTVLNRRFVEAELVTMRPFLDTVERTPLSPAQSRAVVVDEDCNLVVAAAGSGKTSVIVAKAGYLIAKNLRQPGEMAIMAYGRDAAHDIERRLAERVGVPVPVKTFHALGRAIVSHVEGHPPSLSVLADDRSKLEQFLRSAIRELLKTSPDFEQRFLPWFQSHFAPYRSHWEFESWGQYWQYVRDVDLRTLKGERVKSYEECEIANWLYLQGIDYLYEPKYEHDVRTPERRQYKPDFYLPGLKVYLEHFALSKDGRTPSFIDQADYLRGIAWKRQTHQRFGTTLIETYSHEKASGTLLDNLRHRLEALPERTLTLAPISLAQALDALEEQGRIDAFTSLTATFLRHFKGGQFPLDELLDRARRSKHPHRSLAYVGVFGPIFQAYETRLKADQEIDFEDMIATATAYVEARRFVSPFGYIMVDEFQDISVGRAKLLKAFQRQREDTQLFCVGDDWQAIFRFAGSDISLMRDFPAQFGVTERTDLEQTFRCVEPVTEVASRFILNNPSQIQKTVRSARQGGRPAVFIGHATKATRGALLRKVLRRVERDAAGPMSVLLLGRYRDCAPDGLSMLQREFPMLALTFMTVHKSKGQEADVVVILDLKAGRKGFPSGMVDDPLIDLVLAAPEPFPHAEERRLFYVALTRAKHAVYLLADSTMPSAFVLELERGGYPVIKIADAPQPAKPCPTCMEGRLTLKEGRFGSFRGCSHYPLCEYTETV